ncbi:polyamine oxidase-like protein [Saccharata proteae CBS 121410]|uniref:Polyamine oxidase-like protein n=1 Tax=Saccharata proteae CBS 121410 TaxID=1314787 RepID=A0A9P4HWC0_9PEZI|nr:polyamine oxidase-like protein [Saccharata proteae CBS 121410]
MLSLGRTAFALIATLACFQTGCSAYAFEPHEGKQCRRTTVAVLGAGTAGITAAQALSNASISDFLIVEYNDHIGGRVAHTDFGTKDDGSPYVVELGANWVQGLGTAGGPENPIWTFAKKWNVTNTYSNYSSILTYNETGAVDYTDLLDDFEDAYAVAEQNAGYILTENLQDRSTRAGFSLAGWKPKHNMAMQAVEWWCWDWETAWTPEESSFEFGITGYNATFYQFSEDNNYVWDQRGFNTWIIGQASTYLKPNDSRLLLNTVVKNISYSDSGVTIYNEDGSCISAAYAICTFSLGVLQNDVVEFTPALPDWKQTAIEMFQMGTYTKIFLQFNETFWDPDTQFFLYASPTTRGYYPVWQSLSTPGFIPGSNIIFVTVVEDESHRIEKQSDEQTKAEVMEVLRQMFPDKCIPEPIDFMYPRWSLEPWAHGSYSNWPTGTTLEMHQNLRANVERLWFAGEALSAEYFGFLQGAWFEGREAGERIAGLLGKGCVDADAEGNKTGACGAQKRYEVLHGTTEDSEYDVANGWPVSTFLTYGDV